LEEKNITPGANSSAVNHEQENKELRELIEKLQQEKVVLAEEKMKLAHELLQKTEQVETIKLSMIIAMLKKPGSGTANNSPTTNSPERRSVDRPASERSESRISIERGSYNGSGTSTPNRDQSSNSIASLNADSGGNED